ncbi:MAG: MarR family winged helix-turn-helix transcriptional regulator [Bellilinea sp.]
MDAIAPAIDQTAVDADTAELYELAYQLSHLARRQMHAALAVYSLTLPQFSVLKCVLSHQNNISVSALAEATHQVLPTITGILNRLEERGLVVRRRSPTDRRTQLISITPPAENLLAEFSQRNRSQMSALLAKLNPDERRFLLQIIRTLMEQFTPSIPAGPDKEASLG